MTFADGAMCETTHNDSIDQWLERLGAHSREHRVFRLERRWQFALLALVITVAGTWAFLRFGLPATADRAARLMPHSVETAVGEGGLKTLDSAFFDPSRLHPARQTSLQSRFDLLQRELGDTPKLRLSCGMAAAKLAPTPSHCRPASCRDRRAGPAREAR